MIRKWPLITLVLVLVGTTQVYPQRPPRGKADTAAQPEGPSPALPRGLRPKAFALLNAKVMIAPGETLDKANIIVRDGFITGVGPDVAVPPDAIKIDIAGKTVCAGFIDALGSWGYDAAVRRSTAGPPAAEDLASEPLVATKPDNRKGVTPEFSVSGALKIDEETADSWRRAGVTAHVVAPEGGIVVGQSAIVSLSGAPPRESVLLPTFAQHIAFRSPPGNEYPRVLLGVFAHARQLFLDGQHYRRMKDAPANTGRRLPFDPALEAVGPLLERKQLVLFEADTRDEIHRALDFAAEFNLRPAIYGGRQAWRAIDRLKKENVPLVLRVNLSEPNEDREKDLPTRAALERNRVRYDERLNAKKLAEAEINFAIGSMGSTEKPSELFRTTLRQWIDAGLTPDKALAALTTVPAKLLGLERTLGSVKSGFAAHLLVCDGDPLAAKVRIRHVFSDGVRFDFEADDDKKPGGPKDKDKEIAKLPKPPALPDTFVGPWSPADLDTEVDSDRTPALRTGGNVLLRGATVLTVASGTLTDADILVRDRKIAAVGKNLTPADKVTVINCKGMFIMPGIIDTHSHFASSGGLNEFSLSVVPETRVRDVVDGDDVQIYRAAAGGVTTARLLHGSANCVGGQDAVIKMKYRQAARDIVIHEAPRGVKFALGENVKRTDGRFPNTRLGVEAVLIRAFSEARDYQRVWDEYYRSQKEGGTPLPEPRRDLRLEALADILKGDLRVHCHCYRADEILMLLRVADSFGFKIRSLQHVLEGYKIAPEIAAHGASCSLFSDWWAYKIEAFDAIPFAAALLHDAGAMVCLKSDSNELMRHMYQEAAKCVKYGGMSENEALKTITLNGAKQLGLERRLGSIEVGKDADLAVFNGHPLNGYSRVELTLIDGEIAFQRDKTFKPAEYAQGSPAKPSAKFELPKQLGNSYAITGATVHPVTGPARKANLLVNDGKITQIGSFPIGGAAVDATGLHIYPGMIDAGTVLGLAELESARETQDYQEGGDFQPDLRAAIAVNPDSELIPVTRANGVLAVVTRPTGSVIAGQGALINLAGWVPREMIVVDPIALHVEFPSGLPFFSFFDPTVSPMSRGLAKKQRDDKVRKLKELFQQALAYEAGRVAAPKSTPVNPRLAAMVPYAKGEKPVIIQAQRHPEIREALKLAEELKLKMILSGATDAWKVADELKRRDVPVIVGPTMAMPQESDDPFDSPYSNAAKLHLAGVRYCIRSEGASNARNLPYQAAMAVSYGLPVEEGLKAVTLYPAQILGVADQLGSLDVGKRAHLVITNGDMLQASTQVLAVAIDGKMMAPESKQSKLYDRYRQRLQEVKDGKAILGTK